MNSTLNFPPLTGTHNATRKANLPRAVHLDDMCSQARTRLTKLTGAKNNHKIKIAETGQLESRKKII